MDVRNDRGSCALDGVHMRLNYLALGGIGRSGV